MEREVKAATDDSSEASSDVPSPSEDEVTVMSTTSAAYVDQMNGSGSEAGTSTTTLIPGRAPLCKFSLQTGHEALLEFTLTPVRAQLLSCPGQHRESITLRWSSGGAYFKTRVTFRLFVIPRGSRGAKHVSIDGPRDAWIRLRHIDEELQLGRPSGLMSF